MLVKQIKIQLGDLSMHSMDRHKTINQSLLKHKVICIESNQIPSTPDL